LNNLTNYINQIVKFGINPNVDVENKTNYLKKLLLGIYYEYTIIDTCCDENLSKDEPEFDSSLIRKNIEENFPDFDFYYSVLDSHNIDVDPEVSVGDVLDDLTDIIKGFLIVNWKIYNTNKNDALWHFKFFMSSHLEQHLVDFLKYLKAKVG